MKTKLSNLAIFLGILSFISPTTFGSSFIFSDNIYKNYYLSEAIFYQNRTLKELIHDELLSGHNVTPSTGSAYAVNFEIDQNSIPSESYHELFELVLKREKIKLALKQAEDDLKTGSTLEEIKKRQLRIREKRSVPIV